MKPPPRKTSRAILSILCAMLMLPASAQASDLYLTGELALGPGLGESGGSIDLGAGGIFPNTGDDMDSSPIYGGAFGYEFSLAEMFPDDWDWSLPEFGIRSELEFTGGRDYELVTSGPDPYLSRVGSWAVMSNYWMDFPVHPAVARLLGRVPLIEPMSFYAGAGVGLGSTSVDVTNNAAFGAEDSLHFAWQAGMGFGYELTDRVAVSLGYRYVALGSHEMTLVDSVGDPVGNFSLDLSAHELAFGLRVRFFTVPPPGEWGARRDR
jgi:opacity protein-like surface antigen